LEAAVHGDAPVKCKACGLRQLDARPHTHAQNHKINFQAGTVLEGRPPRLKAANGISQVKLHALFFMQRTDDIAQL
jgi:hypothetical protein